MYVVPMSQCRLVMFNHKRQPEAHIASSGATFHRLSPNGGADKLKPRAASPTLFNDPLLGQQHIQNKIVPWLYRYSFSTHMRYLGVLRTQ